MSSPGCCCDHVTHGGRKFGWCSGGVGGLLVLGQAVEQAVQLGVGVAPPTTTDVLNPEPADDVDFGICCGIDRVARLGWTCCTIDVERGSGASTLGRRGHRRAGCHRGLLLPIPGDPHTDREPRVDRARGGATDHGEEQDAVARRGGQALPGDRPAVQRGPGAAGAGVQLWRAARQVAGAGTNATQMRQLRATVWPSAVRSPMKQLLTESAAAQPYWRQAAEASTREELARSVLEAARHDGTGPANKIRRALGLDDYNETDVS